MKKAVVLLFCVLCFSACASKNNISRNDCVVSSMQIVEDNRNIKIDFIDNGCKYSYKQLENKVWQIKVYNGTFALFTPNAENGIKKDVPVIKKNNKEVILYFAENGYISQKNNNSFIYNQKEYKKNISSAKASYIENIICSNKKVEIQGNGAFRANYGMLLNGQKYVDIFDVTLKSNYIHSTNCKNIKKPVMLLYPRRIRYFIDNINGDVFINNSEKGVILSLNEKLDNPLITAILEEKTLIKQKIIFETTSNINVLSVNSTPGYTTIILKGRYNIIPKALGKSKLKGSIFKNIEINKKSTVTEIRLYNKSTISKNYISVDRVDNKLIIYAVKS